MFPLRLYSPAEDWREERWVRTESELEILRWVASRNKMPMRVDEKASKVFLGRTPVAPTTDRPQPLAGEVEYPLASYNKAKLSETDAARYGVTGIYQAAPLIQPNIDDRLSKHFTAGEFLCQDPSYECLRLSPLLLAKLEKIREEIKVPLRITSAYRPPAYNASIGGVSNSCHIDGLAADITSGAPLASLLLVAQMAIGSTGGVGYYPSQGFVHIDVRGHEARWTG